MQLVNAKKIVKSAFENGYAVPHININNLEWTKIVLQTANDLKSPIILGVSEGALKYMGGHKTVVGMVEGLMEFYNISVPVALHLDHGSFEGAKKAVNAGFTSVMFDGSHLPFAENFQKSQEIITLAHEKNISVELEVGTVGGEEDGIIGDGQVADINEVTKISTLDFEMIAAGINNIHGPYPANWSGLNFDVLSKLKNITKRCIVLHGGSGIPDEQIKKAISMGVAKINVNTELQLANAKAIKQFILSGEIDKDKNFDPRKLLAPGVKAMQEAIIEKIELFGAKNQA